MGEGGGKMTTDWHASENAGYSAGATSVTPEILNNKRIPSNRIVTNAQRQQK